MSSPGKVTKNELMEILFGYLMFSGLDKIMSVMAGFIWPPKNEDEKAERGKQRLQLVGILLAVAILFWYKFKV
jgi:hypothetical protein